MLLKAMPSIALVLLFGLAAPVYGADMAPVVDAEWVQEHRDEVTLIHTSRRVENFGETGFIPDAPFVAMGDFLTERPGPDGTIRYLVPAAEDFQSLIQAMGVDSDDPVVIVPAGTAVYGDATVATRLYWQMRYYDHEAVALLDGGVAAWAATGGETVDAPVDAPENGRFEAGMPQPELLATSEEVAAVVADEQQARLVDNRPLAQFTGLMSKDYVQGAGHLPGARPLPFNLFVAPRDGIVYWRDADEVRGVVDAMLPDAEGPIINYCNSGHVSSLAWFAMSELDGRASVALYDGSLHEWTLDGQRPLVIGRSSL